MSNPHQLYTNGTDVLRIAKYVPSTESIQGRFILYRDDKGCEVTLKDFLKDWKVFNAHAAFADYLLYTDEMLMDYDSGTVNHMMAWAKGRCLEIGILWATTIKLTDLELYCVDIGHCSEYITQTQTHNLRTNMTCINVERINKRLSGDKT